MKESFSRTETPQPKLSVSFQSASDIVEEFRGRLDWTLPQRPLDFAEQAKKISDPADIGLFLGEFWLVFNLINTGECGASAATATVHFPMSLEILGLGRELYPRAGIRSQFHTAADAMVGGAVQFGAKKLVHRTCIVSDSVLVRSTEPDISHILKWNAVAENMREMAEGGLKITLV